MADLDGCYGLIEPLASLRATPYWRENCSWCRPRRRCYLVRLRPEVSLTLGAGFQGAVRCCLEQCDVRSHVLSEYVGGGSVEIGDVVRASVQGPSLP